MNNLQLFIAAGLPTITALIGILLNQRSISGLEHRFTGLEQRLDRFEQRVDARMDRVEARLDRIEADLREFYRVLGMHDARLDIIEKRSA